MCTTIHIRSTNNLFAMVYLSLSQNMFSGVVADILGHISHILHGQRAQHINDKHVTILPNKINKSLGKVLWTVRKFV